MSETPGTYAGMRALQAGFEEGQAWRDLALALLAIEPTVCTLLQALVAAGGHVTSVARLAPHMPTLALAAKATTMRNAGLIIWTTNEWNGVGCDLTPFGARVAALVGEG